MRCPNCNTDMEVESDEGRVIRYRCPECGARGMRGKGR